MKINVDSTGMTVYLTQFEGNPEFEDLREHFKFPKQITKMIGCGLWDERDCELITNFITDSSIAIPCEHFVKIVDMTILRRRESGELITERKTVGYYPKVLVAVNEGGYNSTGICVKCLMENTKKKGTK